MTIYARKTSIMKSVAIVGIWLLASSIALGQGAFFTEHDLAEPRVQWDHGVFGPVPEGPLRLEVYYKIFNDGLTYRKENGHYLASYRVEILVYQDGDQVAATTFEEDYQVESFPRTLSQTDFLVNQLNLALEGTGDFDAVFRLRDLKSNQISESHHKLKIPSKRSEWALSTLEFARLIEPAEDTSQFNKMGWLVVPSVSRSYGGSDMLRVPIYIEVYGDPDAKDTPLQFDFQAWSNTKEEVFDTTIDFTSAGRTTVFHAELPVEVLGPGNYELRGELRAGKNRKFVQELDDTFRIGWSVATLLRNDFKTAVEQLKYIASDEERDSLQNAPDSLREAAWDRFWERRDPTPGTPMNEFRDEYYRRIRYVNAAFTVGNQPGWRTDRGIIYIRFGEPDEVERHPFDMSSDQYNAPWQVWYYYAASRRFVFVDRRGNGDYELQYPYDGDPYSHYYDQR